MNKKDFRPSNDAALLVFYLFSRREQFRITSRLITILRCLLPTPETRWYDYCMLMWPDDPQLDSLNKYITLADIYDCLSLGKPLRKLLLAKGFFLAPRRKRRIRRVMKNISFSEASSQDPIQQTKTA